MRVFAFAPALLLVTIGFVTAAAALPMTNSVRNQLTPAVKSGTPDDHPVSGIFDRSGAVRSTTDTKLHAREDDADYLKDLICNALFTLQLMKELEALHPAISDLRETIDC
ncbi:hypothetical protein OG21DRAFT_380200 [Imleria badia]|nr:hypothetical protein OG21DRAFT_380200 [Imleria badia]